MGAAVVGVAASPPSPSAALTALVPTPQPTPLATPCASVAPNDVDGGDDAGDGCADGGGGADGTDDADDAGDDASVTCPLFFLADVRYIRRLERGIEQLHNYTGDGAGGMGRIDETAADHSVFINKTHTIRNTEPTSVSRWVYTRSHPYLLSSSRIGSGCDANACRPSVVYRYCIIWYGNGCGINRKFARRPVIG